MTSNPTVPEAGDDPQIGWERGAPIGRFLVLEMLGIGGMGVVLAAYDPDLDRKVAVKLLRDDVSTDKLNENVKEAVLREAQAMARVSHPNVVTVHEVGVVGERAYVVMEFVEGTTLRHWLEAEERPFGPKLEMMLAAGAGLAAAHHANVVHRDFKPENVLVGKDGRPRVSDFGLAAKREATGSGTRGYMPPEQIDGQNVDARADQFSFCVTVWEAIQGVRPTANSEPPAQRKAPAWIFQALARGLRARPEDRWPSMDALLAALRPSAGLGPRLAIAAGLVLALGTGVFLLTRGPDTLDCATAASHRMQDVWGDIPRDKVQAAFAATKLPYQDATWRETRLLLDRYSDAWRETYTESCQATNEGRHSQTLLDLRMECLERRRSVLGELVRVWNEGMTPEQLDAAIDATRGLPALEACSDLRGLTERAPLPADRQTVERIRSARAQVAVASALLLANRVKDAKREAETARRQADATGWPQVLAEAALVEARILDLQHDAAAKEPLQAALRAAFEARDDRLGAEVLLEQLYALDLANKSDEALRVSDLADAMILRLGDDARLRSQWLRRRAAVLITAGRYEEARALLTFAWVRAIALFGEEDGEAIDCLGELVRTVDSLANFPEARRLGERHLAATRRMFGEEHPRVVKSLTNLGTVALHAGNHEDAAGYYRRSLAIEENTVGPDAARTAGSLNNLGTVEMTMGHYDVARSLLERAQAIRERVQGPDHPYVAFALHNLGMIARKQGRLDDAFALLRRALAIKQKAYGPEHPSDASTHTQIGVTFTVMGRHEEALAEFRRVLEIRTKVLGAAHADTAWARRLVASSLIELGRYDEGCPLLDDKSPPDPDGHRAARQVELLGACELGRGRAAQAVLRLDEVREMRKDQSPSVDRGIAHWLHARALWAAGRKVDAIEAAKRALPELAVDAEGARDLAAVRAWLAARGAR